MKSNIEVVVVPIDLVEHQTYIIRGQKVLLDTDLAALYDVETKVFTEVVQRHALRIPEDFIFPLSPQELNSWRSQSVAYHPHAKMELHRQRYAFTEHGVTMLAAILDSGCGELRPERPQRRIGFGPHDADGIEG